MRTIVTYETSHGTAERLARIIAERLDAVCINVNTPYMVEDETGYDALVMVFGFRGPYTAQMTKLFLSRMTGKLRNKHVAVVGEGIFSDKEFPVVAEALKTMAEPYSFQSYFTRGQLRMDVLTFEERHLLGKFAELTGMELKDMGEFDPKAGNEIAEHIRSELSKAPVIPDEVQKKWICSVCGYVHTGDVPPEVCPNCKKDAAVFKDMETGEFYQTKKKNKEMKKFVCTVCGYVYEGETAPAQCPVCKAGSDKFKEVAGEMTLAAEHEYGIYAKTVKNNDAISAEDKKFIFDQLMANFNGECSEVGMYLCMARIAHREGYPEIGLYWEKAAYEEAEHAAKFAEMLGEDLEANMKTDTKANLAWRVECEFGATAGKTELAKCAKMNNLDAIHDTVHEMARDEARHGKALKGLLERYFK